MTTRFHDYGQAATQCQPLLDAAIDACKESLEAAEDARDKADALFWALVENVAQQGAIAAGTIVGTCWGSKSAAACVGSVVAAIGAADLYQQGGDFQAMLQDFIKAEEERYSAEAAAEKCAESASGLYDDYYKCFEHYSPKVHWMDASPTVPADPPLPND